MKNTKTILWLVVAGWFGCSPGPTQKQITTGANVADTTILQQVARDTIVPPDYDTTQWTEVSRLLPGAVLDLRYATNNNFVDTVMYDCGRCFLRPEVALAIRDIQGELAQRGLRLKFFDCYRPRPIQYKLWEKVPDPRYVADPRKGSMHNRGSAVDLTIIDADGKELDMGTDFDFFGPRAYHNYTELSDTILANRQLLKSTMEKHQFRPTSTEWWHYSYIPKSYPIADMLWACPTK